MAPEGTGTLREGAASACCGGKVARSNSEGDLISREGEPQSEFAGMSGKAKTPQAAANTVRPKRERLTNRALAFPPPVL